MRSALHGCRNTSTLSASIGFYRLQANLFDGKSDGKIFLGVLPLNFTVRRASAAGRVAAFCVIHLAPNGQMQTLPYDNSLRNSGH